MSGSSIVIDSNNTGLRITEEATPCVLASNPVWYDMEPNSYPNDFGGGVTTQARNPINASRQRKKGAAVDNDAAFGLNQDLTQENAQRWLRGFFVADYRERSDTKGFTRSDAGTTIAITNVDGTAEEYDAASGLDVFSAGDLILASGFTNAANNGLKVVASVTSDTNVEVTGDLVDEASPPAAARLTVVGFQFGTAEVNISVSGDFATLTRASGTKDFTDFGLLPGEAVYVGGDSATTAFSTAANNGRKRVRSVTATTIVFDKSDDAMSNETGTGKTIQLFLPSRSIKDEANPDDRVRRYYQAERQLGSNTGDTNKQAQYVAGGTASELSLNLETASLGTMDLNWLGLETQNLDENDLPALFPRSAVVADAIKSESSNLSSSVVAVTEADAFNTSSDLTRIRLARVSATDEAPTPIVSFLQTLTLSIDNNANPNKALGVFGSFNVSLGTFAVSAALTGYFSDIAAITAVETAEDVTLDWWQVKNNAGIVCDLPLITLSDGRPAVEQDQVVTIPLNSEAATGASVSSTLNHTLMISIFDYLPTAADA